MTCAHCPAVAVTTVPEPLCLAHAVAFFQALLVYAALQARPPAEVQTPSPVVAARAA